MSYTRILSFALLAYSASAAAGFSFASTGYSSAVIVHNLPFASKYAAMNFPNPFSSSSLTTSSISNPGGSVNDAFCSSGVTGDGFVAGFGSGAPFGCTVAGSSSIVISFASMRAFPPPCT